MDINQVKQIKLLKLYELLQIFRLNRARHRTNDWILFSNYNHKSRGELREMLIDIVNKGVVVYYPGYIGL